MKAKLLAVGGFVLVLLLGLTAWHVWAPSQYTADATSEGKHEQVVYNPRIGAAYGVERWSVKTGTDSGARAVNLRSIYQTSIASLA